MVAETHYRLLILRTLAGLRDPNDLRWNRPDAMLERHGRTAAQKSMAGQCALKCLGGVVQGKLAPCDEAERRKALDAGHDLSRVLTTDDLVSSDDVFFAALPGDAVPVGHDPQHQVRARPVEAARLQHRQFRLAERTPAYPPPSRSRGTSSERVAAGAERGNRGPGGSGPAVTVGQGQPAAS